jgi:hypothetical protein
LRRRRDWQRNSINNKSRRAPPVPMFIAAPAGLPAQQDQQVSAAAAAADSVGTPAGAMP